LKFQIGTSSLDWGGRRKLPIVFTEQGVAMLSSALRSPQVILINIEIMPSLYSYEANFSQPQRNNQRTD